MIDLENPSSTCSMINDYPTRDYGMTVGIINGLIKSCGSWHDTDNCYDYDAETNTWITSASLIKSRATPSSSFIDGTWLISGDGRNPTDASSTTEMWTGTGFQSGPQLPIDMFIHCQLTINSTHIFFVDTYFTGNAYLLEWNSQTWTELPPMTGFREYSSCGLINNPENGIEAVIVEDGSSEIFNFRDETWRAGPYVDQFEFELAGYAQVGDTFVVVGGYGLKGDLDTIQIFDHINYDWILMDQRLQVPRRDYPGVVAVPNEFVTCS